MTEELKANIDEYVKDTCVYYRSTHEDMLPNQFEKYLRSACVHFATEATKELQEENERLAKHILELQKDKGVLTDKVAELEEQIEKMKSDSKTAYIKGIRTMANALKEYDRTDGAWTDYFEHTVDKVLKNLLKEFSE